jgi:hypothetical protein
MPIPVASAVAITPTFIIGDTISITYTYTGALAEVTNLTLIRWYKGNVHQSSLDNKRTFAVTGVRGDTWKSTVTVCDGTQYGLPVTSNTGTMLNNLPSPPTYVNVVPHTPVTGEYGLDDLTVSYGGSVDPDGDRVVYILRWYEGGVLLPAYNDKVKLPYTEVREGYIYTVTVDVTDNYV